MFRAPLGILLLIETSRSWWSPPVELSYKYEPQLMDYAEFCPEVGAFDFFVREAALDQGLDPDILVALILHESACDPEVIGDSGRALGLGQIHPKVWRGQLKKEGIIEKDSDLFDPEKNIKSIAYIAGRNLKSSKGDKKDAIRMYNGSGPKARAYAEEVMILTAKIRSRRESVETQCAM